MRRAPALETAPELRKRADDTLVEEMLDLELITPLCGGGAEPQVNDPDQLIRGASVRGCLRFWWRATQLGRFGSLQELKAAEDRLWGSTDHPSEVTIAVTVTRHGEPSDKIEPFRDHVVPAYAGFPLASDSRNNPRTVQKDVAFKLYLRYPGAHAAEVRATLWAWTTFGGVGGRVRRGFGALSARPQADRAAWLQAIAEGLKTHVHPDAPRIKGIPSLHGARYRVAPGGDSPFKVWVSSINKLKTFRQNRRPGNEPNRPGRSYWPEPDEVRRLSGQASSRHSTPVSSLRRFPRAVFGLPIIFQFKDKSAGDPSPQTLKGGKGIERLASPLILRPLRTDRGAVGLALVLTNSFHDPEGLVPEGLKLGNRDVQHRLTPDEAASIPSFKPALGPDILGSFLDYFHPDQR